MSNKPMIPVSEERVAELDAHLKGAGKGLFESPEAFINLYNSGIMNKSNDEVKETTQRIVETYKNIREQSSEIVFLSEAEVALNEVRTALEPWYIVASLKRVVADLVEDGVLRENDEIAFGTKRDIGYVLKSETSTDEQGQQSIVLEKVGKEKLFTRAEQIETVFEGENKIIRDAYDADEAVVFTVREVLGIDDSFAVSIRELL